MMDPSTRPKDAAVSDLVYIETFLHNLHGVPSFGPREESDLEKFPFVIREGNLRDETRRCLLHEAPEVPGSVAQAQGTLGGVASLP